MRNRGDARHGSDLMADGITASFMGRLPRDAELRYTERALPLLKFSVAAFDRKGAERGEPRLYVACAAFGRLAEELDGRLRAGDAVRVEGRLRLSRWRTRHGEDRHTLEVTAWSVEVLDSRRAGGRRGGEDEEVLARGA